MREKPEEVLVPVGAIMAAAWFFENSLDSFLCIDTGVVRKTNATWAALTGWSTEETIGQSYWSFVHPEDLPSAETAVRGLAHSERSVDEHRLLTKTGDWLWVRSHAVRGDEGWVLAIVRDITAERERDLRSSEARRAASMMRSSAGVTIWRYNPDIDEYDLNPDFAKPRSLQTTQWKVGGDGVRPSVHHKDAPALHQAWTQTLATGEANLMEYRERTAGQAWRRVRVAWQGVRRLASGSWEVLGISQDITALADARDAAMRGERAALAAVEAKGRFLANMSHELRTPMNGVLGVLHLLASAPARRDRQRLINQALASGVGLSDLLNDIIEYSDVETGRLELCREAIDPAAELKSMLALAGPKALAKGVELKADDSAGDIGWIVGDPARLRKMYFHLVDNAVKFTQAGIIRVTLSATGEGDGRRIRFTVIDTGVGIPQACQHNLFERFSQADGSTTRRFGGPGLGLAVTKRLAELMGGDVGFVSVEGAGSTFWFEISAPAAARPQQEDSPEAGWLDGLRVLVVEDNPTNRLVATGMLSQMGAEVVTANDGAEGVAAVEHSHFDLIFMDIQMPVMDGVEATRRIRAMAEPMRSIPIVATTANVMPDQIAAYRRSGINGVVAKPISPSALIAEVARVAGGEDEAEQDAALRLA
jgi:PAS domain S-box-containing protein